MNRTGWNAVIYDVDWARFASGQEGIAVYKDGKECETIDEQANKVIIEANVNDSIIDNVGHILFKQKGSNNTFIICIKAVNDGNIAINVP